MTVAANQAALIEKLLLLPDPQERLSHIVSLAAKAPHLPQEQRTPEHRVAGCLSHVWLTASCREGHFTFLSAADSPLVAALVHLLCELYRETQAADILTAQPTLLQDIGIWQNLSPTRQNGLLAVIATIRRLALVATAAN